MHRSEAQQYSWSTFAGAAGVTGSADTPGSFNIPFHLARDSDGNVYVSDYGTRIVRKIGPGGAVSTLAGTAGVIGIADGTGGAASFAGPSGIAVDSAGTLYLADFDGQTIRRITAAGVVTTLAGKPGVSGSADGVGSSATFFYPFSLALDAAGNLYVTDSGNHTIRKIAVATGAVTTLAGQAGAAGYADGAGAAARFNRPFGLALDGAGNLVVGEIQNCTLRRVTPSGVVTTLAGLAGVPGSRDGVGTAARLSSPYGLIVDGTSNTIFFADAGNHTVRSVTADGRVSTLCGLPGVDGFANGAGTDVRFSSPTGIVIDGTSSTLLVSDAGNHTIRRVTFAGVCTTWLGTPGVSGQADTAGVLVSPTGIARAPDGTFYVSDFASHVIRRITPAGVVSVFAGQTGGAGTADGTGGTARFNGPAGLDCDSVGNLYVADLQNSAIRKISPAGVVTTLAGLPGTSGAVDGTGTTARFASPFDAKLDSAGNVYVADTLNGTLRKITPAGVVTTVAGLAGSNGSVDGTGASARFLSIAALATDAGGNVWVADALSGTIRKVTPGGVVTTVAGLAGSTGSVDGTGTSARFKQPFGLRFDPGGNLLISETSDHTLRKMTPAGVVTTLCGVSGRPSVTDGVGAAGGLVRPSGIAVDPLGNAYVANSSASVIRKVTPGGAVTTWLGAPMVPGTTNTGGHFNRPEGLAVDAAGNAYVADRFNHTIRKITPGGVISTVAGAAGQPGSTNAPGGGARFNSPAGVAVDGLGNLYVADSGNHTIRKVSPIGDVSTIAGAAGASGSLDGVGGSARFSGPEGVCLDATGANLYVTDYGNHTIRQIFLATSTVSTFAGSAGQPGSNTGTGAAARFFNPRGVACDALGNLYVADTGNNAIRKITPGAVVSNFAGAPGQFGAVDATGTAARFFGPAGITVDAAGTVFVAEFSGATLRRISPAGVVTTIGGLFVQNGGTDGIGSTARFNFPTGIAVDALGNLFVGDSFNYTIRKGRPLTAKARMTSPALGAALPAPTTVFEWEPGTGATQYALWIGRTPGGYDLYAGAEGTNLSKTVALPPDTKVYVTLYSLISGAWQGNSYAYEPAPSAKAAIISPAQGSTLTGSTLSLQWSAATGATQYAIWVGNSYGGYDLGAAAYSTSTNTATFTGIPMDGGPVYVTLWSLINGSWQRSDHWYVAQSAAGNRPATLNLPAPNGGTLSGGGSVTFSWINDPGVGATGYAIWIGSTPGGYDLYAALTGTGTVVVAPNIPADGRRIYVTLYSLIGGAYLSNSYWFTCANTGRPGGEIASPAAGATLGSATLPLTWFGAQGVTNYVVWIGSTPGGYDIATASAGSSSGSANLTVPTDGRVLHITLWSLLNGVYQSNSSWCYAFNSGATARARLTSHASGQALSDAANTFTWNLGTGVTPNSYAFWLGSAPGGYDLYAALESGTSRALTLPTDGRKIYATLYSLINGAYQSNSYVFTAPKIAATKAVLTSPANTSTLTGSSATFNWAAGTGATKYILYVGSTPGGYDRYVADEGTGLTRTVTNLPTDGRPLYVTLYSLIDGSYQASSYVFNAWQSP